MGCGRQSEVRTRVAGGWERGAERHQGGLQQAGPRDPRSQLCPASFGSNAAVSFSGLRSVIRGQLPPVCWRIPTATLVL